MSDKVILDQVLSMLKKMEVPRFTFVDDRGFYSNHNLELLSREGYKFTIPVPSNVAWQKRLIMASPIILTPLYQADSSSGPFGEL